MKNQEKLDELALSVHQAERDLQWANEVLEEQPENSKFILQVEGHKSALQFAKERYQEFKDDLTESNYKLDDDYYDPNEGSFTSIPRPTVVEMVNKFKDDDDKIK